MRKGTLLRVAITIIVSFCFFAIVDISSFAFEKGEETWKMTELLKRVISEKNDEDIIPIIVEIEDVDDDEMIEVMGKRHPEMVKDYYDLENGLNHEASMEVVQKLIETKRAIYRELYAEKNRETAMKLCSLAALDEKSVRFISEYSPFICFDVPKEVISVFTSSEDVLGIEYNYSIEIVPELNYMTKVSRSKYIRDTYGLKGTGVGIGMIESYLPDKNNSSYSEIYNKNIVYDPNVSSMSGTLYDAHAANTAAILIGKTNGCAPNATLYATALKSPTGTNDLFMARIEWLLGRTSPVASVINMSAAITTTGLYTASNGTYDFPSRWIDHIAMQHNVHFVKSSGNNLHPENPGGFLVTSPGMAYNGITVGSYDVVKTEPWETTTSTISDYSCYDTGAGLAYKPDLVAPGYPYTISGSSTNGSGTSNSAPMVSGIMAQLISARPELAGQQRALKAILLASSWNKLDTSGYPDTLVESSRCNQMFKKQGVGKVDAKNARYTLNNNMYCQTLLSSGDFPYSKVIALDASASSARVALVWLKRNKITGDHFPESGLPSVTNPSISNLDLYIYAPDGTLVASSKMLYGNVEVVQFNPTVTGNYTIRVIRTAGTSDKDAFALAWW